MEWAPVLTLVGGELRLEGYRYADLPALVEGLELRAKVDEMMHLPPATSIVLQADRAYPSGDVIRAIQAVARAGSRRVQLVVLRTARP